MRSVRPAPFRLSDIADMVAATGVPRAFALSRLQSYVKKGLIRVRVSGRNTSPNLFTREDAVVALTISKLDDSGCHAPLVAAVAVALYEEGVLAGALSAHHEGSPWVCRVNLTRGCDGSPRYAAEVCPPSAEPHGFEVSLTDFGPTLAGFQK